MKKIIQIIIVYLTLGTIYGTPADSSDYSGIRFYSMYDDSIPTFLNLTPNDPIYLSESFTLSFEFAIWKTSPFGFIASGREGGKPFFLLTYIDYQHPDTSYFELSFGSGNESISIGIPKSELTNDHWFNTELLFDLEKDSVSMTIGNLIKSHTIPLPSSIKLQLSFGKNPQSQDTPNMDIRGIQLQKLHWPLSEGYGQEVTEISGNENGILRGGSWLVQARLVWNTSYGRRFDNGDIQLIYNQSSNEIMVWSGDSLITIDCDTWNSSTQLISEPMNEKLYLVEDGFNKAIIGFNGGGNSVVGTWNKTKRKWDSFDQLTTSNEYHERKSVVDPRNGDVYMMGGYGHYKAKNHIQKYDKETKSWGILPVKVEDNEFFTPRGPLAASITKSGESVFIFGGFGNESGDQEKGFQYFYDLWQFHTDDLILEKLWEWEEAPSGLVPKSVLIIPERDEIYMLGQLESETGDSLLFYRSSLSDPNFEIIDFSESMHRPLAMFYLEDTDELGLIQFKKILEGELHNLSVLTIGLPIPLLVKMEDQASLTMIDGIPTTMWIFLLGIIVVGGSLVVWRRNRSSVIVSQSPILNNTPMASSGKNHDNGRLKKGIMLRLDDDFQLWVDGKEIELNGIDRRKQMIGLLSLLADAPEHRLSHEQIKQALWPLVVDESFVNSLNVTLSVTRKALAPYQDQIIHQNKMVAFGERIKVIPAI